MRLISCQAQFELFGYCVCGIPYSGVVSCLVLPHLRLKELEGGLSLVDLTPMRGVNNLFLFKVSLGISQLAAH